jgi:hypothetical protein
MDVTATPARPFSEAAAMLISDCETLMWLADSGAIHHMTNKRGDFLEYRQLTDRMWVKGISVRVVGVGSVRIIVKTENGEDIPAVFLNALPVPKLSRRASWPYHRLLFCRAQARCVVLVDPADHLRFHAAHGGCVRGSYRAFSPFGVAVSADCFFDGCYGFSRYNVIGQAAVAFKTRLPWQVSTRRAFDNSYKGFELNVIREVGLL